MYHAKRIFLLKCLTHDNEGLINVFNFYIIVCAAGQRLGALESRYQQISFLLHIPYITVNIFVPAFW